MNVTPKPPSEVQVANKQHDLQSRLAKAIREAVPAEIDLDNAQRRVQGCYRMIAELLVDLRHEFPGPNGEPYDLQGRSSAYRAAVREAYGKAGAEIGRPIPKRLTVGVAYWVKKILIERYGEKTLYENGTISRTLVKVDRCSDANLPADPAVRLDMLVGMLNTLAVDPRLNPSQEAVRSAFRAVLLLQNKLHGHPQSRQKVLTAQESLPAIVSDPAAPPEVNHERCGTAVHRKSTALSVLLLSALVKVIMALWSP